MAARSRKRGRRAAGAGGSVAAGRVGSAASGAAGDAALDASGASAPPTDRSARTEAKNEAVRRTLEPLAPGQRPAWVTYAAVFAAALGLVNVALYLAGVRVAEGSFANAVIGGAILLVCAVGMWQARYWAVLGFEVLMGVTATFGALSLLVASSVKGAAIAVGVLAVSGTFFWKLIRAMARIQMPQRRSARDG